MSELHNSSRGGTQTKPTTSCRSRVRNQSSAIRFEDSDEISGLLEALWQSKIFFPLKDAVTTSFVSKSWLKAWTDFSALEFHFDHNGEDALEILIKSNDNSLLVLK
ncbi:F-box/FBD/LRR-repeat protein [Senna tora]|uniref:F-box/FBD/LRR-repeat protein n=1 Tax=Senna tora TaxID=362788 RepID=A0A834W8D9_9FABA|nr:F-box/FBD/LRR-repeat protein [Senna tora]